MLPIEAVGYQCDRCGGVLLGPAAQKRVLGQGLAVPGGEAGGRADPRSGVPLVRMRAGEVELDASVARGEIWFDRGELLTVRRMVAALRGESQTDEGPDPLRGLDVACADCGEALGEGFADSPVGLVCARCVAAPGFDAQAGSGRREVEHAGARVVIEHVSGAGRYRGVVQAQRAVAGALEAQLAPRGLWRRLVAGRGVALGIAPLDAAYHIRTPVPEALRAFVRQRGVVEVLLGLAAAGAAEVLISPRELLVRLSVSGSGAEGAALRLERDARRLLARLG